MNFKIEGNTLYFFISGIPVYFGNITISLRCQFGNIYDSNLEKDNSLPRKVFRVHFVKSWNLFLKESHKLLGITHSLL
ncbi:MAG: hypothetical protein ACD_79C01405G0006 [uncultured bacterium]|nr:MAG: hypothetical protein ACD_79C01405G0006 [uncultured bacterium]